MNVSCGTVNVSAVATTLVVVDLAPADSDERCLAFRNDQRLQKAGPISFY
jgi:hypothetical protein